MKHSTWLVSISTFFCLWMTWADCPASTARTGYENIAYTAEEKNFTKTTFGYRYLLFKPNGYSKKSEPFPVIVFLHGAGTSGTNLDHLKPQVPLMYMIKNGKLPFVVIAPLSRYRQAWDAGNLNTFLHDVLLRNNLDRSRVYLTGMSMGGQGTLRWAAAYPKRFAAIAPVAGANTVDRVEKMSELPVWAFHGAKDDIVPIQFMTDVMLKLKLVTKTDVRYTVYPDEGHGIWKKAYSTTELYDWFLSHTNPDPID